TAGAFEPARISSNVIEAGGGVTPVTGVAGIALAGATIGAGGIGAGTEADGATDGTKADCPFRWGAADSVLSSASCGALATTKRSFCLGSTARYPSSSSSIENLESGPLSPRSLRASCSAACHCLASTQYFSSELFSPTRETSTNHRIKIQSPK